MRREVLCSRRETTYGTDPGVTLATDAKDVLSVSVTDEATMYGRHVRSLYLQPSRVSTIGQRLYRISTTEYLRGSNSVYSAAVFPQIDAILTAAGMTSSYAAPAGVETHTYIPSYDACGSAAFRVYRDGILYPLTGVRGDASIQFTPGAPAVVSFNGTGRFGAATDTPLTNPAYTSEPSHPPIVMDCNFAPYADAPTIAQFGHVHNVALNFRMGTEVVGSMSCDTTSLGVLRIQNTGAGSLDDPGIEVVFDAEQPVTGALNPDTEWLDRFTAREISVASSITVGDSDSNRFVVSFARLFCQSVAPITLKGMPGFHVVARLLGSAAAAAEDSLTITCD